MEMTPQRDVYIGRPPQPRGAAAAGSRPAAAVGRGRDLQFQQPRFRALVLHAEGSRRADPLRDVPHAQQLTGLPAAGRPAAAAARAGQPVRAARRLPAHRRAHGGCRRRRAAARVRRAEGAGSRRKGCSTRAASGRCRRCRNASRVVTSPTGAAIRDVLHILARRFPPAAVLIYPDAGAGRGGAPSRSWLPSMLRRRAATATC